MLTRTSIQSILTLFVLLIATLAASSNTTAGEDLYSILGISRTATLEEIKAAYRRKALDTHPDKKNQNVSVEEANEVFRRVVHAFEVLSDESSRGQYDRNGNSSYSGGGSGGGRSGGAHNSSARNNNSRPANNHYYGNNIEARVIFNNRHTHPVGLYWISEGRAHLKAIIEPNSSVTHYSRLMHEWHARDARVEGYAWSYPNGLSGGSPILSRNSGLGNWKIGLVGDGSYYEPCPIRNVNVGAVIDIRRRECLDLSGHCRVWSKRNGCMNNFDFMRQNCMHTCGHCSNNNAEEEECRLPGV